MGTAKTGQLAVSGAFRCPTAAVRSAPAETVTEYSIGHWYFSRPFGSNQRTVH